MPNSPSPFPLPLKLVAFPPIVTYPNARELLPARFSEKVRFTDDCWHWTAAKVKGYGRYRSDGRCVAAHRFAYELLVGPIPQQLECDHLCRNRACVNPDHLELVTHAENMRRQGKSVVRGERLAEYDGVERCAEGHIRSESDRVYPSGRVCMECKRKRDRDRKRRLRGQAVRDARWPLRGIGVIA